MTKLMDIIAMERRLQRQRRENRELSQENEKLQAQVERLRTAMRRCVACEYHPRNQVSENEG